MAPETPKAVSSRLLTMKFMQRAVASSAAAAASPSSPDTEPQSSSKRRKLQHQPSPAQSRLHAQIDEAAIKAALEDQEAKRQAALSQHLAADSHWVLNPSLIKPGASAVKTAPAPLNIVYVGYGDIDSGNESGYEDSPQIGRTYNQAPKETEKKKKQKKVEDPAKKNNSDSDSGSGSSDDSDEDDSEASDSDEDTSRPSKAPASRTQSRSRSRPSLESIRAKDFRDKRRQKEVRLNKITSISSGGGSGGSNSPSLSCFNCKQSGHKASNCSKGPSRPPRRG